MRFLDTNIILRYLTGDDPVKAAACFDLFQRLKQGREEVITCEAIITEAVYVLASRRGPYQLTHDEIRARLAPILALKGLKIAQKRVYLRALDIYASYPSLDFEDALCAAHMEKSGLQELYSYDTDFDRLVGLRRVEP